MSSVNYNRTEKLRFWCQKVLPIVYDDSLSYYELLNKVVVYLNSTIEDVQSVIDEMTTLEQSVGNKIDKTQKGVANGVATLDGTGKVPLSQLPDVSAGVQTISVNGVNVPADANRNVNIVVMTNAVSNLVNYYLKSETYSKSEVNTLIDNVKNSRFEVVAQLPTSDIQTNVIYLVPKVNSGVQNGYDEYINLDGTTSGWELIGSTDIDLSGYVTDSELATALTSYVTTQALNATLADYVSNSALATALSGYVQMSMFNALSGVVSQQGEALADRVDIFAVTQSRETGDTATTLHNVNTFVWVDKLTNIFGSHLFKVTQTVNVGDNWASIKSSKLSDVTVSGELRNIEDKIPATASASNKLATAEDITATVDLMKDTTGWLGGNEIPSDIVNLGTSGSGVGEKTLATDANAIAFVGEIKSNTNYVISAEGGNRFRVALATVKPANGTTVNIIYDNASVRNHSFNSGAYNYIYLLADYQGTETLETIKPMLLTAEQYKLNPSYRPYHESVEEYAFSRSEQAELGAVNELNNTATSDTIQGLETTVNADKSVSIAAGTVTGGNYVCTLTVDAGIPAGKRVFLSGCPKGGSTNTYMLAYQNASDQWINAQYDVGNGTWIEDGIKRVAISIINGVTVSAMTFKPMISLSDKTPYAPFAMTNRELTEKVFSKGIISSGDDLNNVTDEGIYTIVNTPTNSPENTDFCGMIVQKSPNGDIRQIIFKSGSAAGYMYIRSYSGNPLAWQSWFKFTGTVVS